MEALKRYRTLMFIILFPAFILLMGNSIVNRHTHQLANGVVMSHAHPYQKLPDNKQHSHSDEEFFFLNQLTAFFFCFFLVSLTVVLTLKATPVIRRFGIPKYAEVVRHLFPNRAPPYLYAIH